MTGADTMTGNKRESDAAIEKRESDAAIESRNRYRRSVRLLGTAILSVGSIGVLLWVAPPAQVIDAIGDMSPVWLLAVVGLEIGSCLSYVVVFRRFFPEPP